VKKIKTFELFQLNEGKEKKERKSRIVDDIIRMQGNYIKSELKGKKEKELRKLWMDLHTEIVDNEIENKKFAH
jgi:hypothetical protein